MRLVASSSGRVRDGSEKFRGAYPWTGGVGCFGLAGAGRPGHLRFVSAAVQSLPTQGLGPFHTL